MKKAFVKVIFLNTLALTLLLNPVSVLDSDEPVIEPKSIILEKDY